MKPKIMILITSGIFLFIGLSQIFIGRSGISIFDSSLNTEAALNVLVPMQEIFGASLLFTGLIFLFARNIDLDSSKKLLLGNGIGIFVFITIVSKHIFFDKLVDPGFISLLVFAFISFGSIYTYYNPKED